MHSLTQKFKTFTEEALQSDECLQGVINECFERVMSAVHMMHDEKKSASCVESVAIANDKLSVAAEVVLREENTARVFYEMGKNRQLIVAEAFAEDADELFGMLVRSRINLLTQLCWIVRLEKRELAWVRSDTLAVGKTTELLNELDEHLQALLRLVSAMGAQLSHRAAGNEVAADSH